MAKSGQIGKFKLGVVAALYINCSTKHEKKTVLCIILLNLNLCSRLAEKSHAEAAL